jgi:hypothetical protein
MKRLLPILAIGLLSLGLGNCSKKDDPQAGSTAPTTQPTTTTPAAKYTVTNAGVAEPVIMAVEDYSDGVDNGGTTYHRAVIVIYFPNASGPSGGVKYFLTSTSPLGTVSTVSSRSINSYNYQGGASGTLTGRTITTAGTAHLYLSGTFVANLGTGRTAATGSFTDLKAY